MYRVCVVRLFLALWLGVFSVQASGVLAVVAADDCVEITTERQNDTCPDSCPRCVCCARMTVVIVPSIDPGSAQVPILAPRVPVVDPFTSPVPRGILHVPRAR